MGTRCDFYVGHGTTAEWVGSYAYDGYEVYDSKAWAQDDPASQIAVASSENEYREVVKAYISCGENGTLPEQGWPWPWEDSCTTDYAYCFVDGRVECYQYGHGPVAVGEAFMDENGDFLPGLKEKANFPNMTAQQNVTMGARSGVLFLRASRKSTPWG